MGQTRPRGRDRLLAGLPALRVLRLGDPLPREFDLWYDLKTVDQLVLALGPDRADRLDEARIRRQLAECGYDVGRFERELGVLVAEAERRRGEPGTTG